MISRRRASVGVGGVVAALLAGCSGRPGPALPSPSAISTPFPVTVSGRDIHATWFDNAGRIVVKGDVSGATVVPKAGAPSDPTGEVRAASAVLYRDNHPAATFSADSLHLDRDSLVVVGVGNVILRSLTQADTPAIRADTMTWRYKDNQVAGHGNVVITRKPDIRVPATAFTADTELRTLTLQGGNGPVTGHF